MSVPEGQRQPTNPRGHRVAGLRGLSQLIFELNGADHPRGRVAG
jgi:hypothetical protein